MLIAKKSQRRFDVRRFRGHVGHDHTPALSEGTFQRSVFKHGSHWLQQVLKLGI